MLTRMTQQDTFDQFCNFLRQHELLGTKQSLNQVHNTSQSTVHQTPTKPSVKAPPLTTSDAHMADGSHD